jgi:Ca-activated chloride channel family protein
MMNNGRNANLLLGLLIAIAISLLLPIAVAGQEENDLILTINQLDDSSYPSILMLASVTDQAGNPIEELAATDYSLFQEGNQLSTMLVTTADESQLGLDIVLVVDTSGSMSQVSPSGQTALNIAQEATKSFINDLDLSRDQVALISFSNNTILTQPFSRDLTTLEESIDSLSAEGETRLFDATHDAVELVTTLPQGRKAIILLTDGQDTESRLTIDDIRDRAEESSVPIYSIGLGSELNPIPLERLATLTGGRYLNAPTSSDIGTNLNIIAEQLRKQYAITFVSDIPADDRRHPINLVVNFEGNTDEDASSFHARPRQGNVIIESLLAGEIISSPMVISPTIEMPGQISQVSYFIDSQVQEVKTSPPFNFDLDPNQYSGGSHTLLVRVIDHVGNQSETSSTFETVAQAAVLDVTIISPNDGDELTEPTAIVVEVEGITSGVEKVEFRINDVLLETRESAPFEYLWDVTSLEPGTYKISAIVYDGQGNQLDDSILVNVVPPTMIDASFTGVLQEQIITQSAPLAVSVNESVHPVDRVQFLDNGQVFAMKRTPPYEVAWIIEDVNDGPHVLSARIFDSQGNIWEESIDVTVRQMAPGFPDYLLPAIIGLIGLALVGLVVVVVLYRRNRSETYYPEPYAPYPVNRFSSRGEEGHQDYQVDELTMEIIRPSSVAQDPGNPMKEEQGSPKVNAEADVNEGNGNGRFELAAKSIWYERPVSDRRHLGPAYLVSFQESTGEIDEYPISEKGVSIGRSRDVDILLHDTKVSREHAEIRFVNGDFVFTDNEPTNPSYINGQIYQNPQVLKDGDQLIIGVTKLVFKRNE